MKTEFQVGDIVICKQTFFLFIITNEQEDGSFVTVALEDLKVALDKITLNHIVNGSGIEQSTTLAEHMENTFAYVPIFEEMPQFLWDAAMIESRLI